MAGPSSDSNRHPWRTLVTFANLFRACAALTLGLAVAASAVAPAQASFVNLGPAGDFNDFVYQNNTQFNTDAEGRVAVGGNANFLPGYTVASSMGNNTDNLIVRGDLTNQWNTLHGGALVGGNLNWQGPTIFGRVNVNGNANFGNSGGSVSGPINVVGTYTAPNYYSPKVLPSTVTAMPFDFDAVQNYLLSMSSALSAITPNGTTSIVSNQVHLQTTNPASTLVVFNVTGAQMAAAAGAGLFIDAPAGATVVVNVSGATDSMTSMGISLTGGVDKQHVLYNYYQASSLTINSIGVLGTILAPNASVNFAGGNIDGTMIAKNLSGSGESHWYPFQGSLPPLTPIPEPSTIALAGLGTLGLAFAGWRKRRAS
jgi:choice-of-anchor A domain-containing protein